MRRSTEQLLSQIRAAALLSGIAILATTTGLRAELPPDAPPDNSTPASLAQFRLPRLPIPIPPVGIPANVPSLQQIMEGDPPLTTSLDDVVLEMPILDGHQPATFSPMTDLPWDPQLGYLALPGAYSFVAESYCLMAGTHGPGGGNGYGYAELEGPRSGIVRKLLQEAANHPDIPQRQIQVLLWGIISRTQLRDMSADAQAVAQRMLTDGERQQINGGALGLIPQDVQRQMFANLPRPVRQVLEAEANLRRLLTQGNATYQQLEEIAVLTGAVDMGAGSRQIPQGRWSLHPEGYFVRYQPSGYSRTQVEAWVPEATAVERDGLNRIVAIATHDGYRVETDYNDQVGAIAIPGEPDLRAYQFSQIRLISPGRPTVTVNHQGWTFVGTLTGNGQLSQLTAQAQASERPQAKHDHQGQWLADADRINDLYRRYHQAKEAKENVDAIVEEINRIVNPPTREQAEGVLDQGHYRDGLDAALGSDPNARGEWLGEHFKRVQRGWIYAICELRSLGSSGGCGADPPRQPDRDPRPPRRPRTRPLNPGGQGVVPGNTNRQRLGISARPGR